ncbi:MAG: cation:dicarboxylase symporter family transporter [Treponema sp.]|jgi:Na+/H+-dicarboxylate symporter|nr:cation:dicarboxylase symporter family transporter [Treponema sp.]
MKVWLKLLIGSVLGVVLGFLLPADTLKVTENVEWLAKLAIHIGRYAVVPLLIFSLTSAIYELRQDNHFWSLLFRSILAMAVSAVIVISAGIIAALIFPPARIPISNEKQLDPVSLVGWDNILELFPSNMFNALVTDGAFLLPVCVFAFFAGIGLSYDRNYSRQVITLIDSLSRFFYHIAAFFSEILGVLLIFLGAYWAIRYREALRSGVFLNLVVLLTAISGVLGFIILPLFLWLIRPKINPLAAVYGSLGPALAAFFSGDINFTLPVLLRHVKENLGVRRRANAVTLSLFAVFGRAGSAMVAAIAFIVIIKSYSSLGLTVADVIALGLRAWAISFLLIRHPGNGAYVALAVLCLNYGKGFEAGYLNLKPLAFYMAAVGAFLDVMISAFASCVIAGTSGLLEKKNRTAFI